MAKQWLVLTTEASFKTKTGTPVLNTDYFPVRLDQDNAFTPRVTPQFWEVLTADADNEPVLTGTERSSCPGRISMLLYATHAPAMLRWALARVNQVPTPKLPWVTSEPRGDLGTMTADYAIEDPSTGTQAKLAYRGGKVLGGELLGNNTTDLMRLNLDVLFADTAASVLAEPAITDYPTDPYAFQDLTGGTSAFKIGTATTNFQSFALRWRNNVVPKWDESSTPVRMRMNGRRISWEAQLLYKATPDRRAAYVARTAQDVEFKFDNGSKTALIDLNLRNFIQQVGDILPLGDEFAQTIGGDSFVDTAQGASISLAFT